MNFGAMFLDKIRAEQQGAHRAEVIDRYVDMAEAQLRKALTCKPPTPPQAYFMLGRLLHRRGRRGEARELLKHVVDSAQAPVAMREEAKALLAEAGN